MSNILENNNETREQHKFKKKVYSDKSKKLLKFVICILIFDFVIYGIFACFKFYDFGIFFEFFTFIFICIAIINIDKYLIDKAKTNIIIAMIPIGWILIYDTINLFVNLKQIIGELIYHYTSLNFLFYAYFIDIIDIPLLLIIILLFKSYKSLGKDSGDIKYEESTDWFYDKK